MSPSPVGFDNLFYLVGANPVLMQSDVSFTLTPDLGDASNFGQSAFSMQSYDYAAATFTGSIPSFVSARNSMLYLSVFTQDDADIGYYRVRAYITIGDTLGLCQNNPTVQSDFTIIVFGMESQPLEDMQQYISYNPVLYDFPKFI